MIRFLTAGESHGKALTAIIDGFPSNIPITPDDINTDLARRQMGYGRGGRMKIETDTAEILSGIRFQKTIGSPISLLIRNRDWENWVEKMSPEIKRGKDVEYITVPRPGHADLTGVTKYDFDDIRNSIERSSARETAARVAAGAIAKRFLSEFGITVGSFVEQIGGIYSKNSYLQELYECKVQLKNASEISEKADLSLVRVLDSQQEEKIVNKIKVAKKRGDTLGGTFVVVVTGLPVGLGTYMQYDRRLDADLAHAILSINAVKGVEVGAAFENSEHFGSTAHDEINLVDGVPSRRTNRAGGLEGGITTGLPLIVRGAMKPIATLMQPIGSIDLKKMEEVEARRERSDFVAVPACGVIGESMVAWVVAQHFLTKFGGDSLAETKNNYQNYIKSTNKRVKDNFKKAK